MIYRRKGLRVIISNSGGVGVVVGAIIKGDYIGAKMDGRDPKNKIT